MIGDPKDLGALFDAHTEAEFKTRDIDATMATMGERPHVTHVPTMTGGFGRDQVRRFYETWFIGHWPEDTVVTPISRTVGEDRVVDEVMISFTHDCEMPALLPGGETDRPQGYDPFGGRGRVQRRQDRIRTHLLGPSLDAGSARAARRLEASGIGRRTSRAPARSDASFEYADSKSLTALLRNLAAGSGLASLWSRLLCRFRLRLTDSLSRCLRCG